MNKKRSEWANEEGSALVLTLMIFLVLTVLATSISFLTVGSFRLSDINRDGTSAFYIAEAGAKKAYEKASQEVMKTYEATTTTTSSDFYAALDDALFLNEERPFSFDKQFGDDAKANVTFTATDSSEPRKYTLTSIGSVGGKTRTVQKQFDVSWVDKGGSGGLPDKTALITQGRIDIFNDSITGDIYTYSTTNKEKSVIFRNSGPVFNNTTLFFPNTTSIDKLLDNQANNTTVKYKEFDTNTIKWEKYEKLFENIKIPKQSSNTKKIADVLVIDYNAVHTLKIDSQEVYISSLSSRYNSTLILEPMYDNTVLFLDSWENVGNKVEIKGEKKVTIVVKDILTIRQNAKINFKDNTIDSVNKLTLIYLDTSRFHFDDSTISGNIIIKEAKLQFERGSSINGVLLYNGDKEVKFTNGLGISNLLLIAPFAKVSVTSLKIEGTVIANEFDLMGGASLTYNPNIDTSGFPGLSSGPATTPKLEDLLQSGPILEQ
ncbi:pilus assembly PilX N-terminal domain-containing protein [Enterococcus aquimarinus]|uniref:Type 4 fimbrial biogenesis protein PilX N-terminal domain-containing protein n=1 Tax=Enterococcus aquimarinus TaxID=328396 RepID=A0A1L8QX93_9ENTE|nr:pilus assembly PilX N-terminal domain-containing protein [Enterococcus aquimarinus]OJG12117.1 hypothetical protein RU93_GL000047 [Enterococcus aquimarinus]